MLFYECELSYKRKSDSNIEEMEKNPKKMWGDILIQDLNDTLAENSAEKIEIIICGAKVGKFKLAIGNDSMKEITAESLSKIFMKRLKDYEFISVKILSLNEVTPENVSKLIRQAERNDFMTYRCNWEREGFGDNEDFSLNYFRNGSFKIEEKLISEKNLSYDEAKKSAENFMTEKNFVEELERIYSDKNPKKFFGHPVHYKIVAKNSQGAMQMANLLCQALYTNKRLVGRCMSFISEIDEDCFDESDIENIFRQSAGGTIIIELRGSRGEHKNYASCYEKVIKDFSEKVCKYQRDTLFIFVETIENPGFAPRFIKNLQEDIYIVELKEGMGNQKTALDYLKKLIKQENRIEYNEKEISAMLSEKTAFRPSDLHKIYEGLCRDNLRNNTYITYKQTSRLMIVRDDMKDKEAYQILQEMVGLEKIKTIVNQIIRGCW